MMCLMSDDGKQIASTAICLYTLFFLALPRRGSDKLCYVFTALPHTAELAPSRKKVYHTTLKTRTFISLIFFNFEFFEFCPARNGFLPIVR